LAHTRPTPANMQGWTCTPHGADTRLGGQAAFASTPPRRRAAARSSSRPTRTRSRRWPGVPARGLPDRRQRDRVQPAVRFDHDAAIELPIQSP